MHFRKSLVETQKQNCPCGWSRRPFADKKDVYAIGSFHGTIFTPDKRAAPRLHVPTDDNSEATHETYFVTDEDTRPGSHIYLGVGAIEAKPGVLVNVYPGVTHGGTGHFTPLILGVPGFSNEGEVELTDPEQIAAFYAGGLKNIMVPPKYHLDQGLVRLTAEEPTISFENFYNANNRTILIAQQEDGKMHAGSFPHTELNANGFRNSRGLTYIMIRSGNGDIYAGVSKVNVKPLDVILMGSGGHLQIGEGLTTTIMTVNPQSIEGLLN